MGLRELPVDEYVEVQGNCISGEGMEALCPFHTLCPLRLFLMAVPELYPFTINLVTEIFL